MSRAGRILRGGLLMLFPFVGILAAQDDAGTLAANPGPMAAVVLFDLLLLLAVSLAAAHLLGRVLVDPLGAPAPPPFISSPRAWAGAVCTGVLSLCYVMMEVGQAASSDVHSGLGEAGLPLDWAGVFAPWILCRYWDSSAGWELSPSRWALLLLAGVGLFGWYANQHVWF